MRNIAGFLFIVLLFGCSNTHRPGHEQYANKPQMDSNAIVFIGDSHIRFFDLEHYFTNPFIINKGIPGDNVPGVLNRIQAILDSTPQKIFIETGINDVLAGVHQDTIITRYSHLLTTLKRGAKTKIYVQGLLPVTKGYAMEGQDLVQLNEKIRLVNSGLKKLSDDELMAYSDLYSQFVLNNELNPVYTSDGIHLNATGYSLWARILKPFVDEE